MRAVAGCNGAARLPRSMRHWSECHWWEPPLRTRRPRRGCVECMTLPFRFSAGLATTRDPPKLQSPESLSYLLQTTVHVYLFGNCALCTFIGTSIVSSLCHGKQNTERKPGMASERHRLTVPLTQGDCVRARQLIAMAYWHHVGLYGDDRGYTLLGCVSARYENDAEQ